MSYTKQTWANGDIITAAKLNHMEDGIAGVEADVSSLDTQLLASMPHDTASGSIANFPDGAAMPVRNLSVDIEPVQAGSGDPSPDNVRPISGWTECKVTRTGKNVYALTDRTSTHRGTELTIENQTITIKNTPTSTASFTLPNFEYVGKFALSITQAFPLGVRIYCKRTNKSTGVSDYPTLFSGTTGTTGPYVLDFDTNTYTNVSLEATTNFDGTELSFGIQLEIGTEKTDYEPFVGQTYTIDLDGTRYGGTLDVTTGKLTVDRGYYVVSAASTISFKGSGDTAYIQINGPMPSNSRWQDLICSHFKKNNIYAGGTQKGIGCYSAQYYIRDSLFASKDDFINWLNAQELAGTPLQITCKLATPIEVDLTPTEITTLLGTNNIFADCGDTTVDYYADTTLFVNKKIAAAVAALS